eukprot:362409-Chlamydomonas_euryale.AAC.4
MAPRQAAQLAAAQGLEMQRPRRSSRHRCRRCNQWLAAGCLSKLLLLVQRRSKAPRAHPAVRENGVQAQA